MSQRLCRTCHHLVSPEARACPRCGAPRPVPSDGLLERLAPYRTGLVLSAILLAFTIAIVRTQFRLLTRPPQRPAPVIRAVVPIAPGYHSLANAVGVGMRLYRRADTA